MDTKAKIENPPDFTLPLPTKTEWVWWSWFRREQRWARSCWKAETKEDALSLLQYLMGYDNILVKETTTYRTELAQPKPQPYRRNERETERTKQP